MSHRHPRSNLDIVVIDTRLIKCPSSGWDGSGTIWFKIHQEGLVSGTQNAGNRAGGTIANNPQFHPECAQLKVTGSGTAFSDSSYPGINFNIAAAAMTATMYVVPGPSVWPGSDTASGAASAVTTAAGTTTLKTVAVATSAASGGTTGCTVARYGQCSGMTYTGCTMCGVNVLGLLAPFPWRGKLITACAAERIHVLGKRRLLLAMSLGSRWAARLFLLAFVGGEC